MSQKTSSAPTAAKTESVGARPRRIEATPSGQGPLGQSLLGLQQVIGNQAIGSLLRGSRLQPKLRIGPPGDRFEREADRTADAVMRMPAPGGPTSSTDLSRTPGFQAQRMCAECAEEEEKARRQPLEEEEEILQPKAAPGVAASQPTPGTESRIQSLRGGGRPLSPSARSFFEPRFGHDFGDVRVHAGAAAADASKSINARAFTVGRDVVFGAGEYSPESRSGRRLLAHELTHVVQQTPLVARRKPLVQRQTVGTTPTVESASEEATESAPVPPLAEAGAAPKGTAPGLIVADEATELGPGQVKKSVFLAEVRIAACAAAEEGFAGTEHTAQGCPWMEAALRFYEGRSAERLERDMANTVPEAAGATTARDYIPFIAERVRRSVDVWIETGNVTGLPEGLPGLGLAGALAGSLVTGLAGIFFKAKAGGPKGSADPRAVKAELGAGRPLGGSVRSGMESAFGRSLSSVRIHTDAGAARLSHKLNARAFAVGDHVAFGAGEYQPGHMPGDALITHELAHVMQQGSAGGLVDVRQHASSNRAVEAEANRSAVAAVSRIYGDRQPALVGMASRVTPTLRSGLALHRCKTDTGPTAAEFAALEKELQLVIKEGVWDPPIRSRMYAKLAKPIQKRADERRAGTLPDLAGLGRVQSGDRVAQGIKTLQGTWSRLTPGERTKKLVDLGNHELKDAGVPEFLDHEARTMVAKASFTPVAWKFSIKKATVDAALLSDADAAQLADSVAHESRHAEQRFLAARFRAGEGRSAPEIVAELSLPMAVATAAVANPLTGGGQLKLAKQMYESFVTQGAANQGISNQVLTEIDKLNKLRAMTEKALKDLQTTQDVTTYAAGTKARDDMRAQISKVENAYAAYRRIPYESDAHEIGLSTARAFERLP